MGNKKRKNFPDVQEVLDQPWCYYCERTFEDLKILISHQKAKHFKCNRCNRRLNTAGGLSVHMTQVHKENLDQVENALPNRAKPDVEIFGTEGIPDDVLQAHKHRVLQEFCEKQKEQQARTGNAPPGQEQPKRPKAEAAGDLKARLAKFKEAKKTGKTPGTEDMPVDTNLGAQSPQESSQSPAPYGNATGFSPPQFQTQASHSPGPFPNQANYGYAPQQTPPFAGPQSFHNQGPPGFAPGTQQYPMNMQSFPSYQQSGTPPFGLPFGGASTPPAGFPSAARASNSPTQNGPFARPAGLPAAAPGLPERPNFGFPQVNTSQMQQMHQGQMPDHTPTQDPRRRRQGTVTGQANENGASHNTTVTAADVDNLVSEAAKVADADAAEPKPDKKKKKPQRLIYSDELISPEEKMAKLPRYSFDASKQSAETIAGTVEGGAVNNPVSEMMAE